MANRLLNTTPEGLSLNEGVSVKRSVIDLATTMRPRLSNKNFLNAFTDSLVINESVTTERTRTKLGTVARPVFSVDSIREVTREKSMIMPIVSESIKSDNNKKISSIPDKFYLYDPRNDYFINDDITVRRFPNSESFNKTNPVIQVNPVNEVTNSENKELLADSQLVTIKKSDSALEKEVTKLMIGTKNIPENFVEKEFHTNSKETNVENSLDPESESKSNNEPRPKSSMSVVSKQSVKSSRPVNSALSIRSSKSLKTVKSIKPKLSVNGITAINKDSTGINKLNDERLSKNSVVSESKSLAEKSDLLTETNMLTTVNKEPDSSRPMSSKSIISRKSTKTTRPVNSAVSVKSTKSLKSIKSVKLVKSKLIVNESSTTNNAHTGKDDTKIDINNENPKIDFEITEDDILPKNDSFVIYEETSMLSSHLEEPDLVSMANNGILRINSVKSVKSMKSMVSENLAENSSLTFSKSQIDESKIKFNDEKKFTSDSRKSFNSKTTDGKIVEIKPDNTEIIKKSNLHNIEKDEISISNEGIQRFNSARSVKFNLPEISLQNEINVINEMNTKEESDSFLEKSALNSSFNEDLIRYNSAKSSKSILTTCEIGGDDNNESDIVIIKRPSQSAYLKKSQIKQDQGITELSINNNSTEPN